MEKIIKEVDTQDINSLPDNNLTIKIVTDIVALAVAVHQVVQKTLKNLLQMYKKKSKNIQIFNQLNNIIIK